jgi:hypothetical protein
LTGKKEEAKAQGRQLSSERREEHARTRMWSWTWKVCSWSSRLMDQRRKQIPGSVSAVISSRKLCDYGKLKSYWRKRNTEQLLQHWKTIWYRTECSLMRTQCSQMRSSDWQLRQEQMFSL